MHKPQKTAVLFQFTPLREGRRYTRATSWIQSNFNSRPSARGDREAVQLCREENISIHAPPRGATWKLDRFSRSRYISIHAPPRGATEPRRLADRVANAFQFTPLREGRHEELQALRHYPRISIHAPPRGATRQRLPARRRPPHFNSRPSARGDKSCPNRTATSSLFQFTPLREGRHPLHECNTEGIFISIHAPPRGATVGLSTPSGVWLISIHAPPRGATITADYNPIENYISIHAPPRGATRSIAGTDGVYDIFQFTPLREGRLTLGQKALKTGAISIHAPPRGATSARQRHKRFCAISIHAPPRGATGRCFRG